MSEVEFNGVSSHHHTFPSRYYYCCLGEKMWGLEHLDCAVGICLLHQRVMDLEREASRFGLKINTNETKVLNPIIALCYYH